MLLPSNRAHRPRMPSPGECTQSLTTVLLPRLGRVGEEGSSRFTLTFVFYDYVVVTGGVRSTRGQAASAHNRLMCGLPGLLPIARG
jgi:hypothetical protein